MRIMYNKTKFEYTIKLSGHELNILSNGIAALLEYGPDGHYDEQEDIDQVKDWKKIEKQIEKALK